MLIYTCIVVGDTRGHDLVGAVISLNDRPLDWEKIVRQQHGQRAVIHDPQTWLDVPVEEAMEATVARWREKVARRHTNTKASPRVFSPTAR